MNPFLFIGLLGRRSSYLLSSAGSFGLSSRWWLLCLLVTTLSRIGWGQCFTTTTIPHGSNPYTVAVGDFNSDGRPDLVTTNFFSQTVSLLPGNGSGGFGAKTDFLVGTAPTALAIGDFNNDGRPDLAVANTSSNNISILLGNGSGSFSASTNFPVGPSPSSVAVGDFNNDGRTDLAVANFFESYVSVLQGNGSGGFGPPTTFTTATSGSESIAVGDFNGDGWPDLALAPRYNSIVSVLYGNSSGTFSPPVNFPVRAQATSIAVGDFDNNGRPDLAVAIKYFNTVSVLLDNGSGGFDLFTDFPVGSEPTSVAVGDFNSDGRPDLAAANSGSRSISVILGNGSGGFGSPTNYSVESGPLSVAVGDFNSDGKPDLITNGASIVTVLLNCATTPTLPFSITGVTTVSCTTVTATERQLTFTPRYAGVTGQPISFSVVNELLPTTAPGPYTLRLYTDNPTITLRATQTGTAGEATFSYDWLALCSGGSPPPTLPFSITGVTTVSCTTVTATERQLTFTPRYAGVTGQPISFSVVNELLPTTAPGPYTLRLYTDNPTVTLRATQIGTAGEATFSYDWLALCRGGGAPRLGVGTEPTARLQVKLLGNPVHYAVEVEVTGSENTAHIFVSDGYVWPHYWPETHGAGRSQ